MPKNQWDYCPGVKHENKAIVAKGFLGGEGFYMGSSFPGDERSSPDPVALRGKEESSPETLWGKSSAGVLTKITHSFSATHSPGWKTLPHTSPGLFKACSSSRQSHSS